MDFTRLRTFIREKAGLTLNASHEDMLEQEICQRMTEKNMVSRNEYFDFLERNENEFFSFISLLTVNETYFFREPAYIELFVSRLAPELHNLAALNGPPLKVLSAGCSTGEEPYSLLMALMEKYGRHVKNAVEIRGIDIDAGAVEKGALGIYSGQSFRTMEPSVRDRYFENIGRGRFRLKDAVKNGVRLDAVNLLDFPYPQDLAEMDIIFYRNVSIYFKKENQRKIFEQLARLLKPGGCLIVGAAETLSHHYQALSLVEMDDLFFFRKYEEEKSSPFDQKREKHISEMPKTRRKTVSAPSPHVPFKTAGRFPAPAEKKMPEKEAALQPAEPPGNKNDAAEKKFQEALSLAKQKMYDDALAVIEQTVPSIRCSLLKALIFINLKRLDESEQLCSEAVAADPLLPEGHLLLGIITKLNGDDEAAVKSFKTVLYLSQGNWVAHYHLAEIYQQRNKNASAVRAYQNVIRLLEKGLFHDHGLAFFPFSFSEASVMHLCRHHIRGLKSSLPASSGKRMQEEPYGV